jgi:hypothetical protein
VKSLGDKPRLRLRGFPSEAALHCPGKGISVIPTFSVRNRLEVTPAHAMCPWEWEPESTMTMTLTLTR